MVLKVIRRRLQRFWSIVDAEGVGLFQQMFYTLLIAAGLYGLIVAGAAPQAVEESMGPVLNAAWLWLNVAGPTLCLLGKKLTGDYTYSGMWLQLIGDIAAFGAIGVYIVAVVDTSWWGRALYGLFIVVMGFMGTVLFVARDLRRLWQVERRVRR